MIITRRAWVRSETISNGSFKCAKEEVMKEIQLEIRTQKQTRFVINVYDRESRFFLVNTFWRLKGLCNVRSVVLSRKTSNFHSILSNFSRRITSCTLQHFMSLKAASNCFPIYYHYELMLLHLTDIIFNLKSIFHAFYVITS